MDARATGDIVDGEVVAPGVLDVLTARCIGPFRGGRVVAVAGHPRQREVFYMGSTGGGIWRSGDAGRFWENVSDGQLGSSSVGALAIAPSDPNVLYVAMGEACLRSNVSAGDGVYRSTDAGRTWRNVGLRSSAHVGRVRVDPRDPDTAYVAALGPAFRSGGDRGVYRTRDGGRRWQKVLATGRTAGAVDLSIDPANPRVLYAAVWQALRRPWSITSGGPRSGLFRSDDAGDSWTELTTAPGLPRAPIGRIGVSASSREGRVYAVVEAPEGGIFRSDDRGRTWARTSADRGVRERDYYYGHIIADPDPDTVWVLSGNCWRSIDAGRSFRAVPSPHGDHHDLWVDPLDPRRMILGCDGGATVSLNGGESWSSVDNQPTAELYHVTADTRRPYRVYGAQQDSSTISVPSRSMWPAITAAEAYDVGGGESGHIAVRPDDPDIVFAGSYLGAITRYDHRTRQARSIEVWPDAMSWGSGYATATRRFNWTFPIVLSPHDPRVLYIGGDRVFRTSDEGTSWEPISADLSRRDFAKIADDEGTERELVGTVFTLAESAVAPGLVWAGTDDGRLHVTSDGGRAWRDVTPRATRAWTLMSMVEPSPHDPDSAYLAATRYQLGDDRPMLFRTRDRGAHWTAIVTGIPASEITRVIRADPVRRGLLYAGTERGLYVSFDDGGQWHRIRAGLPVVPIHDIAVADGDLVLATHGRSFWIVDDITPLRDPDAIAAGTHLFAPRPTVRYRSAGPFARRPGKGGGEGRTGYRMAGPTTVAWRDGPDTAGRDVPRLLDAGTNPPDGALITYRIDARSSARAELSIHDASGATLARFVSTAQDGRDGELSSSPGAHRVVWDMRAPSATRIAAGPGGTPDVSLFGADRGLPGPLVPPGRYTIRLRAGRTRSSVPLEIRAPDAIGADADALHRQYELLVSLRDALSRANAAVNAIRATRAKGADARLSRALGAIEDELTQTKAVARRDSFILPMKLNSRIATLIGRIASADAPPTRASEELAARLLAELDGVLARLATATARARRPRASGRRARSAPR